MHSSCTAGWRVVIVGSNLNNGDQAGVSYLNANNSASNVNVNISSHSDAN